MKRIAPFITLCLLAPIAGNVHAQNSGVLDTSNVLVVAADPPIDAIESIEDMPLGQGDTTELSLLPEESSATDDDLFGIESGFFHPYISAGGAYTDNLYNVNDDTTSNVLTTISPGIWLSLPRKRVIPIIINPHNSAPGGLPLQIGNYDESDKLQIYALGGADFLFYSEDSDLNTTNAEFEGLTRYNMASGLSLQVLDRYAIGHDDFSVSGANETNQREYQSNIVMMTADWDITDKLRIKGDFSNFYLDYDNSLNDFLDRSDNSADVYAYFKYSMKSSFFVEYKYTDVAYDTYTQRDNKQDFYYGGVTWDTTDKLALRFKAGLQQKDFDDQDSNYTKSDNLVLDLQLLYRFTEKTKATLDLYNLNEESDSSLASETEVFAARFNYTQMVTDKITGAFGLFYENSDYNQLVDADREDDTFEFTPSVQYLFKDWLMGELAYSYETVDSSDNLFDYDTNTVYFTLNFSL